MAQIPQVITIDGHKLRLMEKPAKHRYYCKGCKERDVRPCYKHEDEHDNYHLHKECYDSCTTYSIMFNLSGSKSNCDFIFHKESLRGKGVCDACGDDVQGWFYKCKICKKPHYLHPCCAKLPIKKYVDTREEEIVIDLKAKSPSNCLICRKKENSDGFSGWYYISRCGNYCYHWSCMKHMALKKWKRDDDQCNKRRIHKPGMSSQALKTMTQKTVTIQHPNHGRQMQDYAREKRSEALRPHEDTKSRALPTRVKDPDKRPREDTKSQALPTRAKDPDKSPHEDTKRQASPTRAKDVDKKPRQDTKIQAIQQRQDTKQRPRLKGIIRYTAEVAGELLNIFIPLIFGLPPLPLGLVLNLLK